MCLLEKKQEKKQKYSSTKSKIVFRDISKLIFSFPVLKSRLFSFD